jgi:site-specific DNA-cytosine methylase
VKTLATHHEGKSFGVVASEIKKAGYSFIPFILKAHTHSNIPQGRERIYIVGFREEETFCYPAPTKVNLEAIGLLLDKLGPETEKVRNAYLWREQPRVFVSEFLTAYRVYTLDRLGLSTRMPIEFIKKYV